VPAPFVRIWGLTAIALLTGPPDDMRGSDTALSLHPSSMAIRAADDLYRRFDERLRSDPAVALAWGVNREAAVQAWLYSWGVPRKMSPDRKIIKAPWSADVYSWLDHARSAFASAGHDPALAPEAALRTGLVDLYQGRLDDALTKWSQAATTTSAVSLQYLAALFTGRALAAAGRRDAAAAAYRVALGLQPAAQSARTGLAALLYVSGRPLDAGSLVQPLITASSPAPDPWWSYTDNHFEAHLIELRRALH
jgi:tetratricopeptide (TPR) repeat protein